MLENYIPGSAFRVVILGSLKKDEEIENFNIKRYMDKIWSRIQELDKIIQEKEPYKIFKTKT